MYLKLRPIVAAGAPARQLARRIHPNLRERSPDKIASAKDSLMDRLQPTYLPVQPIEMTFDSGIARSSRQERHDGNTLTYWLVPAAPASNPR